MQVFGSIFMKLYLIVTIHNLAFSPLVMTMAFSQWNCIDSTGKVIKEKRRRIEKKQFARSVVDFKLKDQ